MEVGVEAPSCYNRPHYAKRERGSTGEAGTLEACTTLTQREREKPDPRPLTPTREVEGRWWIGAGESRSQSRTERLRT